MIQIVLFLLLFSVNGLEWCQIDLIDGYKVKCFDEIDYDLAFIQKSRECRKEIFYVDRLDVIFAKVITREMIMIECRHEHFYEFIFDEEMELKQSLNGIRKNGTLKGVSNCASHSCDGFCTKCNGGYSLSGYRSESTTDPDTGVTTTCTGYGTCNACGKGTYGDGKNCHNCGPGYFGAKTALSSCSPCFGGLYSNQAKNTGCGTCSPGTYSSGSANTGCTSCPAGKYQPEAKSTGCNSCPAGQYASGTGNTACSTCSAGYYSTGGAGSCTSCPAGKYNTGTGNSGCSSCPAGQYQGSRGQISCKTCSAGYYSTGGAASCSGCGPGKYSSSSGASGCS